MNLVQLAATKQEKSPPIELSWSYCPISGIALPAIAETAIAVPNPNAPLREMTNRYQVEDVIRLMDARGAAKPPRHLFESLNHETTAHIVAYLSSGDAIRAMGRLNCSGYLFYRQMSSSAYPDLKALDAVIYSTTREMLGVSPTEPVRDPVTSFEYAISLKLGILPLPSTDSFSFRDSDIDDDGIKGVIRQFPKMKFLSVDYCRNITDAGLSGISQLANLRGLHISGCLQLTDDTLREVQKLPQLVDLHIQHCENFTDEGFGSLGQRPGLTIQESWTHITRASIGRRDYLGRRLPDPA